MSFRLTSLPLLPITALVSMSAISFVQAHTGSGPAMRSLSWAGITAQVEPVHAFPSPKNLGSRTHALGEQNILGEGGSQTIDITADPQAASPSDLNFERSFLQELPEAADRESIERRHDENG